MKSTAQEQYRRQYEVIATMLNNAGCPVREAMIIRRAFWATINPRVKKPAPNVYVQTSLFKEGK